VQAPPALGGDALWNLDWVFLGFLAYVLTGLFMFSSIGRGRPSYRLQVIFGTAANSLGSLRDAIHAKARGQAAALFFCLGSLLLLAGFLFPGPSSPVVLAVGGVALLALGLIYLLLLDRFVARTLRRSLRRHLQQYPFDFEGNINLTRDIGKLFGVPSGADDTLESYVAKVRAALGITEAPSRLFGRRGTRR